MKWKEKNGSLQKQKTEKQQKKETKD